MSTPDPLHPRAAQLLLRRQMTIGRAVIIIVSVTATVTLLGGVLIHFADRSNFPNVGGGMWWAVQTVTTVGYGDLVPTTVTGRVVATVVMLTGIGFITVLTAVITSTFIETARRRLEVGRDDTLTDGLAEIGARLDAMEATLDELRRRLPDDR